MTLTNLGCNPPLGQSVADVVAASGRHQTLTTLLRESGLDQKLRGAGPYTLLAPSDTAFAKMTPDMLRQLRADKSSLTRLLERHVIAGRVGAVEIVKARELTTLAGPLPVGIRDQKVYLGEKRAAMIAQADLPAENGLVHILESVVPAVTSAGPVLPSPSTDRPVNSDPPAKPAS